MRDVWKLLSAWWRADRVRASPREGRLLRLAPGSIVMLDARPAEVLSRAAVQSAQGPYVEYQCRTADGDCRLRVTPVAGRQLPTVAWIDGRGERRVAADAIDVFAV